MYTWLLTAQGGEKILNVNFIIIVKTKTNDNWQQPRIIVQHQYLYWLMYPLIMASFYWTFTTCSDSYLRYTPTTYVVFSLAMFTISSSVRYPSNYRTWLTIGRTGSVQNSSHCLSESQRNGSWLALFCYNHRIYLKSLSWFTNIIRICNKVFH